MYIVSCETDSAPHHEWFFAVAVTALPAIYVDRVFSAPL